MTQPEPRTPRLKLRGVAGWAGIALLVAVLVPFLFGSTASATPRALQGQTSTTCPTEVYSGGSVNSNGAGKCTTTTVKTHGYTIVLINHYASGVVYWQACGFPSSAVGTTVYFYLNGTARTGPGASGAVLSGGCTSDPQYPICLSTGSFTSSVQDPTPSVDYTASNTLTVSSSGCSNPVTLGTTSTPSSSGPLAFTGTDILALVVIALAAIAIGFAIVRINRQRRRTA